MKRLLCIYQHAPTPGAPGIYRHRHLLSELVRRGWDVNLISSPINYMTGETDLRYRKRLWTEETIEGIDHRWVWATANLHRSKVRRAANYVTFASSALVGGTFSKKPDVIWASSPPLSVGTVGSLLSRRFGVPWVFEVRDLWPESAVAVGWLAEDSALYRLLLNRARQYTSSAARVMVQSEGVVQAVHSHGARQVDVIPPAVVDRLPSQALRERTRSELGITERQCVFLYLGAHGVANGLDTLLDAAKLLDAAQQMQILMVGDGSDRRRLLRRLSAEQIPGVRMLDPVGADGVSRYLAASDVCLHLLRDDPTFHNVMPTKIVEYFSAHKPFITTVAGNSASLASSSGGAYVDSASGLAGEMSRWIGMPPTERAAAGEHSWSYGVRRFGVAAIVDRLAASLEAAVVGQ